LHLAPELLRSTGLKYAIPFLVFLVLACRESVAPEAVTTTTAAETSPPPAPAAPAVNGPKLPPVDEGERDPELAAYRKQLLDAVRRRDADAVIALSDPNIRTDFGGGGGSDDFRKTLSREGVWSNLETALSLGGTFLSEDAFWTPYVYSKWPDGEDAFQSLVVIGENVPLRDPTGNTIATLSHDIVQRTGTEGQVKTADGKVGTVDPAKLWSPVGYRAGFNRVAGKWRMNAFVAGD
jgi:hypothetical protein